MRSSTKLLFKTSLPPAVARLGTDASRRWARLAPREQRLLGVGGIVIALSLIFLTMVEPAWTQYRRLQTQLPLLRTQAATVDALTTEARSLQRITGGKMSATETRQALIDSLQRAGLAATVEDAQASGTEGALEVAVDQVSATSLMQWLESVPAQTRLQLTDAELERPTGENGRLLTGKITGVLRLAPPAGQAR